MTKESIIEKENHFKGDLQVAGNLKILGIAEGNIVVEKCLKVEKGTIKGEVKAESAVIRGFIDGKIECKNYFEMEEGVLNAKIKSPRIIISEFVDYPDLNKIIEQ